MRIGSTRRVVRERRQGAKRARDRHCRGASARVDCQAGGDRRRWTAPSARKRDVPRRVSNASCLRRRATTARGAPRQTSPQNFRAPPRRASLSRTAGFQPAGDITDVRNAAWKAAVLKTKTPRPIRRGVRDYRGSLLSRYIAARRIMRRSSSGSLVRRFLAWLGWYARRAWSWQ